MAYEPITVTSIRVHSVCKVYEGRVAWWYLQEEAQVSAALTLTVGVLKKKPIIYFGGCLIIYIYVCIYIYIYIDIHIYIYMVYWAPKPCSKY